MRPLPGSVQTLIDADVNWPIVTATIALRDGSTTLYVSTRDITISSQAYVGDLMDMPSITVSSGSGVDHLVLTLTDTTDITASPYWQYEQSDYFDGAACSVDMYFATDASYGTLEGPVSLFTGVVSEIAVSHDRIILTVMSNSRVNVGTVGRKITHQCLNTFKDTNCGYTTSATITSTGTFSAGQQVSIDISGISGSLLATQNGIALLGEGFISLAFQNVVEIKNGSTVVAERNIWDSDIENGWVTFTTSVTVASGYTIAYKTCPRDSMLNCARRWRVGSTSPQSDRFLGFNYHNPDLPSVENSGVGVIARFLEGNDLIVPIPYGQRWVSPMLLGVHGPSQEGNKPWASWQTSLEGPFVVALLGEGPVDTGIVTPVLENVMVDNSQLSLYSYNASGSVVGVEVSTGNTSPTVNSLAPRWSTNVTGLAGLSGMPNVAYAIIDLPDGYDLSPEAQEKIIPVGIFDPGAPVFTPGGAAPTKVRRTWQAKEPDIRLQFKGRKVQTYHYVGGNPTQNGSPVYSRNPVWQLLDLISAPQRAAADDLFSGRVDTNNIDLASFIDWAGYADETITMYNSLGQQLAAQPRYLSDLYITNENKGQVINDLLQCFRGSLVEKNGKIGVVAQAPSGGSGAVSSNTTTSLTDSDRDGTTLPTFPTSGLNGLLAGLTVEIDDGAGNSETRTIVSNDANSVTVGSAWTVTPVNYFIYAMKLTQDNIGDVQYRRIEPTHKITNEIVGTFDVNDYYGREGTVRIQDTYEDGFGQTYVQRFGKNSKTINFGAITDWHHAVRAAWYELRRGIVGNRQLMVSSANIEAAPLEVGDIVAVTHPTLSFDNQLFSVVKKTSKAGNQFDMTLALYREELHLDWPTFSPDGIVLRTRTRSPHEVPPHVSSVSASKTEVENTAPVITVSWVKPPWEYSGAMTIVEVSTDAGSTWTEISRTEQESVSFTAQGSTNYVVRAVFVSHKGVRADAIQVSGQVSGGTSTTLSDTGRSTPLAADRYIDMSIVLRPGVTGSPAEEVRTISDNDTTSFTVSSAWTDNPDSGTPDAYYVYVPSPTDTVTTGDVTVSGPSLLQWIPETRLTPTDPSNLSVTEGGTQNTVDLSWSDNSTDEVEFFVYRAPDSSGSPGSWTNITPSGLSANTTTHTDTDTTTLQTQALWWYRVNCRSIYGFSDYTTEEQVDLSLT